LAVDRDRRAAKQVKYRPQNAPQCLRQNVVDLLMSPCYQLSCHTATPCAGAVRVAVDVVRQADSLQLSYRFSGNLADLRLPAPAQPAAADNLWQHTCCEAFIATVDGPAYREFNFSPSGEWAAYHFSDYRQRDFAFTPAAAPIITFLTTPAGFTLRATLPDGLLPAGRSLKLGLSLVLEAADGSKTYWALQHAAVQPDFHLRSSFSLDLPGTTP
jgi:hypothetical protein